MNVEQTNNGTAAALGFLTVGGIFAALAVIVVFSVKAPSVDADRATQRSAAFAEIRVAEEKALSTPAMIDAQKGIVRLPIERAIELAAQAWKNPAAARADLTAREEKATAAPPPVAAQPSAFE